jgi:lipopolysaccharide transport system ATP-binding protein
MGNVAIKFNNISKEYRLGLISTQTLSHDLNRWWYTHILRKEDPYLTIGETNDRSKKGNSEYVWALRDISFEVKKGDVLGIIGKNGAGKSTLLKILSRITTPTTGIIEVEGRIASLLEVGTGFHPELTGRENIYMNGSILGMTRKEIDCKLDEIVDFAGVERYLDTPTKRYSSGMTVRLGFAIAAHLDPEVLVVDEVLAVGDTEFQKKAIGKMQDISREEGRTVLFVSHNMASLKNLCKTGILLENGYITFQSDIDSVIDRYLSVTGAKSSVVFNESTRRMGNGQARITAIRLLKANDRQQETSFYGMGEDIVVEIQYDAFVPIRNLNVTVNVRDVHNFPLIAWRTQETCISDRHADRGRHSVLLRGSRLNLMNGLYTIHLSLWNGAEQLDVINEAITFEIIPSLIPDVYVKVVSKNSSIIYTPCTWQFD